MTNLDVVGVGCCVLDELLLLDRYPVAGVESAIRVRDYSLQGGGPAATAMVAAARMAARAGFVGKVGDDDRGRLIRRGLADAGVDTSRMVVARGLRSTLSVVCVHAPTGRRSFLMDSDRRTQLRPEEIDRSYVTGGKILLLDGYAPAALTAARWARQAGKRVVMDGGGSPPDRTALEEFAAVIDVMIVSAGFARGYLGRDDPAAAAEAIRRAGPQVAAVTVGAGGAYVCAPGESFHQPAQPVEVVDTTGAGDVFHGAWIVGMLENWPVRKTSAFAAAAAGLSCRALGGRAGIPTRQEVFELCDRGPGPSLGPDGEAANPRQTQP